MRNIKINVRLNPGVKFVNKRVQIYFVRHFKIEHIDYKVNIVIK